MGDHELSRPSLQFYLNTYIDNSSRYASIELIQFNSILITTFIYPKQLSSLQSIIEFVLITSRDSSRITFSKSKFLIPIAEKYHLLWWHRRRFDLGALHCIALHCAAFQTRQRCWGKLELPFFLLHSLDTHHAPNGALCI